MRVQTKPGQFHITLRPMDGGAFTEWQLSGVTPTAIRTTEFTRLMQAISSWSGWPVVLALSVELGTAAWFSWWAGELANIEPEHLEVECIIFRDAPEEHGGG